MKPNGLSSNALSIALRVPVTRVNDIVLERRAVTADTALRLARYFGTTAEYWLSLQSDYDLAKTANESGADITRMIEPRPTALSAPIPPESQSAKPAPATRPATAAVSPQHETSPANNKVWARIVAKAWADDAYKKRLLAEPAKVAAEEGLVVPEGVALKMVEAAHRQAWLVLPPKPREEQPGELEARLAAGVWLW